MNERFWKAESGWVLVRVDDGLLPINRETGIAMLIDDDLEAEEKLKALLDDGVPVLDELPGADRPDSRAG